MTDTRRLDYVGRHRKPEKFVPPRPDILRRTFDLFTHGTQPISVITPTKER